MLLLLLLYTTDIHISSTNEYITQMQEVLHSAVRRYESIEEHAFFPSKLPKRTNSLSTLDYPELLSQDADTNGLNWNPILYNKYLNLIVPAIAAKGDDEQYGSAVLADINVLQALSKRIHYGKFVAESKYRSDPDGFQKLVDAGDADGVMKLLTNEKVEEQVLTRARLKAATYGREPLLAAMPKVNSLTEDSGSDATAIIASAAAMAVVAACEAVQSNTGMEETFKGKVDPGMIEAIYRQLIIPMTKDVEVAYLFMRCGRKPPEEYSCDRMSLDVVELEPRKIS
jgi:chorismate mutase